MWPTKGTTYEAAGPGIINREALAGLAQRRGDETRDTLGCTAEDRRETAFDAVFDAIDRIHQRVLERHHEAISLGNTIEFIADRFFGSRPQVGADARRDEAPPPELQAILDRLANRLDALDAAVRELAGPLSYAADQAQRFEGIA